jgi:UDP-hydrolysing UDP-N-acetyl-D-glucosamine 2-epimerase
MKKKVCIITTTRADYGFFLPLIKLIKKSEKLELQIIASGTHLEEKYGNTINEIIADKNTINARVSIIHDASDLGILETMSDAVKKIGVVIKDLNPDMVILLGDRFETFSIASSCVILNIPISHISGGDVTFGANDDIFRHCITKMSYLHFVACEQYKNRVIQLGENPKRVFSVGSLSVEGIHNFDFLSKMEIEKEIGIKLDSTLLATFHPITMETESQSEQFAEFLSAIAAQNRYNFLFTSPNADNRRDDLVKMLDEFVIKFPQKIKIVNSLGTKKYLSIMRYCVGVIGNSSSGILEVPSFKKPTINIGNRQKGRVSADSIIHCKSDKNEILRALTTISSASFLKKLSFVKNPYEQKDTAKKIVKKIEEVIYSKIKPKQFFDIKNENF